MQPDGLHSNRSWVWIVIQGVERLSCTPHLHTAGSEDEGHATLGHQLGVEAPNLVAHQLHEGCPLTGDPAAAGQDGQRTAVGMKTASAARSHS